MVLGVAFWLKSAHFLARGEMAADSDAAAAAAGQGSAETRKVCPTPLTVVARHVGVAVPEPREPDVPPAAGRPPDPHVPPCRLTARVGLRTPPPLRTLYLPPLSPGGPHSIVGSPPSASSRQPPAIRPLPSTTTCNNYLERLP